MAAAALDSGVLVLNRFFQAVQVTSVRRAFSLFCKGYVKAVDEGFLTYTFNDWKELPPDGDFVRTPTLRLRVPRVVQLIYYDKVPRRNLRFSRRSVFMRDHYRCQYCGRRLDLKHMTIDHVVPQSRGGQHTWENVVVSCVSCNNFKGNRTPDEAGLKLLRPPKQPHWIPWARYASAKKGYPAWESFIEFESRPVPAHD